jgi:hypothetical protein
MPHRPQVLFPAHARQHPAVSGGNVAILTAENPQFQTRGIDSNDGMAKELDRLGLDYEPTQGRYGSDTKNSFIVMNPDKQAVLDLARRAGQKSVAMSENGKHQIHYVNGEFAGQATPPTAGHTWSEKDPQGDFTSRPGPNGEAYGHFAWNIDSASPKIPSVKSMVPNQMKPLAQSEHPFIVEVKKWVERLGDLRTAEMRKAEMKEGSQVNVESSSLKSPTWKPMGTALKTEPVVGPKGETRYRISGAPAPAAPTVGSKGETRYKIPGLAAAVPEPKVTKQPCEGLGSGRAQVKTRLGKDEDVSGDVHKMRKNDMPNKTDPLDEATVHSCPSCHVRQSPVIAALRKAKGGVCVKCDKSIAKAEWKPTIKEQDKDSGSGGDVKRGTLKLGKSELGSTPTSKLMQHLSSYCVTKAEGMAIPSAPKPPQAAGAKPTQAAGLQKALGEPEDRPGRAAVKPLEKPPVSEAQRGAMHAAAAGKSTIGIPKSVGKEFADADKGGKLPESSPVKKLHKAITDSITLSKGIGVGSLKAGLNQASFQAPKEIEAPAGKVQPKSPKEFDMGAFHPTSSGPSGLELDQTKRTFQPGHKPVDPSNPLSTQPAVKSFKTPGSVPGSKAIPALKSGLHIAGLRNIRR